jgi:hypothetical protein
VERVARSRYSLIFAVAVLPTWVGSFAGSGDRAFDVTPGVVRGDTWYLRDDNSTGPARWVFAYGGASDVQLAGNWDGSPKG